MADPTEAPLSTFEFQPLPNALWWLSFADGDLPKGQQFLGVCLVWAPAFPLAVMAAHVLGINPGGRGARTRDPERQGVSGARGLDR